MHKFLEILYPYLPLLRVLSHRKAAIFFFPPPSYAYVIYKTHEEALEVFNASRDLKILGKEVIVMFSTFKRGNIANEDEDQSIAHLSKKLKVFFFPDNNEK